MTDPVKIPVFGVMQICEPTVDQGANKIKRKRRAFIAAQYELGVRNSVVVRAGKTIRKIT